MDDLGLKVSNYLTPVGFNKLESQSDWLGFTVNRKEGEMSTFVTISLYREQPLEFKLVLRQWNNLNPAETVLDIHSASFASLSEIEISLPLQLKTITEKLNRL